MLFISFLFLINQIQLVLSLSKSYIYNSIEKVQYKSKLLILQNNIIHLIRDKLVYYNVNDNNFDYLDWSFYPFQYSSKTISKGTYGLIASVRNKDNNDISLLEVKSDLTFIQRITYTISVRQNTCGFSQFNEDHLYILSYIDSSNEGIINLYNYNDDSIINKVSLSNFFSNVSYKVFQCHYVNENNIIICIAFSQSDTYTIILYDSDFQEISNQTFQLYTQLHFLYW